MLAIITKFIFPQLPSSK